MEDWYLVQHRLEEFSQSDDSTIPLAQVNWSSGGVSGRGHHARLEFMTTHGRQDKTAQQRIRAFLEERIHGCDDPRYLGKALRGDQVLASATTGSSARSKING